MTRQRVLKVLCIILAAISIITVSGCARDTGSVREPYEIISPFSSFLDIPGITEEEIAAINALKADYGYFLYGMPMTSEAFMNENGEVRGFTAFFCEWLSDIFGIEFKPVLKDWFDLLDGLETLDISFSGELTPTEERFNRYDMTSAIAMRPVRYFRLADSQPTADIIAYRPLLAGFVESTATINAVTQQMEPGTFEVVELSDFNAVYDALISGEIDAFYYSSVAELNFIQHNDMISNDFYPLIFMPVSLATQDSALTPVISAVDRALQDSAVQRYLAELYNRGYQEYLRHKLFSQLSDDERNYIRDNPVIRFAAEVDNYPLSFYNSHEGLWQGIALDVLREVEGLTGLRFERFNDENASFADLFKLLESGEVALITDLLYSSQRAGNFLWADTPLLTGRSVLISKSEQRDLTLNDILHLNVGLIEGYAHTEFFKLWFPNHPGATEFKDSLAAFDALDNGAIDVVMIGDTSLLILTHYLERTGYRISFMFDNLFHSTIGLNINEPVLHSILNKALQLIDTDIISEHWVRRTYDYRSNVAEAQRPLLVSLSVTLFLILALIIFLFLRSRQAGRRMKRIVKEQTQELSLQTAMLNTLFDAIPALIFIKDLNFRYIQCNKGFLEYFGLSREDIIGKEDINGFKLSINRLVEMRDRDRKVITEMRTSVFEERIPRLDGGYAIFETVKAPLIVNGATIGLMGVAHDITKYKKLEEAALSASQTKSVFLANMSHEIRTPMNSIIGFTELAQYGENPPKTMEYLGKIIESSQWLLSIINDILDISKIESGRIELEYIPFSLHDLFAYCQAAIVPKAREKGIALLCYAEPSISKKLFGDPVRLRQVIMNLLSNAIKFTSSGVVRLSALVKETDETSATICFEVKDSGVGMRPEQISRIFEPFMQGDGSITRRFGGTGLGLAISKSIVELMGGRLNVESSVEAGSKFSFELTFSFCFEEINVLPQQITLNDFERPNFQGEVLVCEDSDLNREVIFDHLTRVGVKTTLANNGKDGVDTVTGRVYTGEKPFDLIFMDIHMPVMDGLEAASIISGLGINTPIVALTANIMANDLELYKANGLSDFLGKPFTTQELWRCLLKYLHVEGYSVEDKYQQSEEYENLQRKRRVYFAKTNRDTYKNIVNAAKERDIKLAHRLAHTLGSNAGQIGEKKLQMAAAAVEVLLSNGMDLLDEKTKATLDSELRLTLFRLEPLLLEDSSKIVTSITDRDRIADVIDELESLLTDNDTSCRKMLDDLLKIPGAEDLARRVEEFEFEQAIVELDKFKRRMMQ